MFTPYYARFWYILWVSGFPGVAYHSCSTRHPLLWNTLNFGDVFSLLLCICRCYILKILPLSTIWDDNLLQLFSSFTCYFWCIILIECAPKCFDKTLNIYHYNASPGVGFTEAACDAYVKGHMGANLATLQTLFHVIYHQECHGQCLLLDAKHSVELNVSSDKIFPVDESLFWVFSQAHCINIYLDEYLAL